MSSMQEPFENLTDHKASISIASGETMEATGVGEIVITVKDGNNCPTPIRLQEVRYVPTLRSNNHISVRCIQQAGGTVVFGGATQDRVGIHMNGVEMGVAKLRRNPYVLSVDTPNAHMNYNQSIAV